MAHPPPSSAAQIVQRTLTSLLGLAALLAALVALFVVLGQIALNDRARVEEEISRLQDLRAAVVDAETGVRGYAIAARLEFLDPYADAFARIEAALSGLSGQERATDQERLDRIRVAMETWRSEFARPLIDLIAARRAEDARELVRAGEGKQLVDGVRAEIATLLSSHRAELDDHEARAQRLGLLLLAILMVGIVAGTIVAVRARREMGRRLVVPLQELADRARRFGAGERDVRAPSGGLHEASTVGEAFNEMALQVDASFERLRELDELRSAIVSTVSHELRTPLTAIQGNLEVLQEREEGPLNDEQAEVVVDALTATSRLTGLVDELLLLSRLESGRYRLGSRPVSLGEVARQAVATEDAAARQRDIEVTVDVSDDAVAVGDRAAVVRAATQLLGNAIKFSPRGGVVEIRGRLRGDVVILAVSDEGVGIPEEDLVRVTERFFRSRTAGTAPGAGLGLAVAREIAERHGGRVEVDSEEGVGTTVQLILPTRRIDAESGDPGSAAPAA